MSGNVEVIGHKFVFDFGSQASYELHFIDSRHLEVRVVADVSYPKNTLNRFDIEMTELGPDLYMVTWEEPQTGNTVTHVEDYAKGMAFANITDIASRQFWRLKGVIRPSQ
jgi:phenolic acid decarboxylase